VGRAAATAAGVQKPLAAVQGKKVPNVVPVAVAERSAPCGPLRRLAGESPGSGPQRAGSP